MSFNSLALIVFLTIINHSSGVSRLFGNPKSLILRNSKMRIPRVEMRSNHITCLSFGQSSINEITNQQNSEIKVPANNLKQKTTHSMIASRKCNGIITTDTDASGSFGVGGIEKKDGGIYFSVRYQDIKNWDDNNSPDILWKELFAVWIMHELQKTFWKGLTIIVQLDNKSVKRMLLREQLCADSRNDLQTLIEDVFKSSETHDYYPSYKWIKSKANLYADRLSRGKKDVIKQYPFELVDKSIEALGLANIAYQKYRQLLVKRMYSKKLKKK
eukprot:339498_1